MSKETFLNYKNWRYAKVSFSLLLLSALYYLFNTPLAGYKGNTGVGITLGVISTLIILYLTYFGIRKRSYRYGIGNLQAILSQHVWLGLILIVLVPLHCGFSFSNNIHSYTYFVMLIVIFSGILGATFYKVLPNGLSSQRGQEKIEELLQKISEIDLKVLSLCKENRKLTTFVRKIDLATNSYLNGLNFLKAVPEIDQKRVSRFLSSQDHELNPDILVLISLIGEKRVVLKKIVDEVKYKTLLKIWLYLHVPFTFLLLILLIAHIFTVLFYWT